MIDATPIVGGIPPPGTYWYAGSYTRTDTGAPVRMDWRLCVVTSSRVMEGPGSSVLHATWAKGAQRMPLPPVWVRIERPAFAPDAPPAPATVAERLASILQPLKGTGEPYYVDDEHPDRIGPDEPIRDAVRDALARLDVHGSGGCRVCLS